MNKRILALFLSMAMLFTLIPSAAFAAEALTLTAESVEAELEEGAEITVPVKANTNPGYGCGTVDIKWDNSALILKSVKYSDIAPDNSSAAVSNSGTYRASFGDFYKKENFTKTGTFFTLTFAVSDTANAGDYVIELGNATLYDSELEAIPVTVTSAKVTLRGEENKNALAIEFENAEAVIGEADEIRVPVNAVRNPGFAVGKVDLLWDSSVLTLKNVEYTSLAPDNGSGDINSNGNYRISFGDMLDDRNVTAKGELFTLVFEINGTPAAGEYQLMLSGAEVYDAALDKVAVAVKSGSVTLTEKTLSTTSTTSTTTTTTTTRGTNTDTKSTTSTTSTTSKTTTSTTSTSTRGTSTSTSTNSTTSTTSTTTRGTNTNSTTSTTSTTSKSTSTTTSTTTKSTTSTTSTTSKTTTSTTSTTTRGTSTSTSTNSTTSTTSTTTRGTSTSSTTSTTSTTSKTTSTITNTDTNMNSTTSTTSTTSSSTSTNTDTSTSTSTTTTTTTTSTTSTTTITTPPGVLYGDVNCDGTVDTNDAATLNKWLNDPASAEISEQGKVNADVYNPGDGLTAEDAEAIAAFISGLIPSLPYTGELPGPKEKRGDINGDGKINPVDASLILVKFAELSASDAETPSDAIIKKYDINEDGRITAVDASLILAYCADLAGDETLTLEAFLAEKVKK